MSLITFSIVPRGKTYQHTLSGRQAGDTLIAHLKPAAKGGGVPDDDVPVAAVFEVEETDDVDGLGGLGWIIGLTAAQTEALAEGDYVFDEKITNAAGQKDPTDPAIIKIVRRVTE